MTARTADFYNMFSPMYPLVDIFLKPQKRRLLHEVNSLKPGKILEIGVGNGTHLKLYKKHQITGIDTSAVMLEQAKRQRLLNVNLLQMDGECLQFGDHTFDHIVLSHVIAVVDNPEKLLEEAYRVLKPGGKIFILNHFTPANWLKYIDSGFRFISRLFRFNSVFHIDNISAIKKYSLQKEISFGRLSYFKLLIYAKV